MRARRGVVHVRVQETKIKLTRIHIFCQNENLTKRKKLAIQYSIPKRVVVDS